MKTIRRAVGVSILAAAACAVIAAPARAEIFPKWDLNGMWSSGIAPFRIHQDGLSVTFDYVTNDFDHVFVGRYVSPTEVVGEYAPRRNRATGCKTRLAVHISVSEPGAFMLDWRALDSNCDLTAGQTGVDAPYNQQPQ